MALKDGSPISPGEARPRHAAWCEVVFDAVRARLIEVGEAVKDISDALLSTEPDLPWREIAGMRDQLAHRYFDTSHAIIAATVQHDLPELEAAVEGMARRSAT